MRIEIVSPQVEIETGNAVTARRWARILEELGHDVRLSSGLTGRSADLLVALHATKSHPSIRRWRDLARPDLPLVVALTGTDLYRDIRTSAEARESLELASRLVVLQRHGLAELEIPLRPKTRVIYQSAPPAPGVQRPPEGEFRIAVVANLRPEKDALRAEVAARELPRTSRIRIVLVGGALSPEMEAAARRADRENPRFSWMGTLPYDETRRLLAGSQVAAITSHMEGSSNVLSEALVSSIPVIASRIGGIIGTLGEDYPGYFPAGDTPALAALLSRVETDPAFLAELARQCRAAAYLVAPEREVESWRALLAEFEQGAASRPHQPRPE